MTMNARAIASSPCAAAVIAMLLAWDLAPSAVEAAYTPRSTIVNLGDYPIDGNPSDSGAAAANNAAFQAAFNNIGSAGGKLLIPCGVFKLTVTPALSVANSAHVKLVGAGPDCTEIYTSGQGVDGLHINLGNQYSTFSVESLTITTDGKGGASGLTTTLANGAGVGTTYASANTLYDVNFRGHDFFCSTASPACSGGPQAYWGTGYNDKYVNNVNIFGGTCNSVAQATRCYSFVGPGGPETNPGSYAVVFNLFGTIMNQCQTGVFMGEYTQGLTMTATNVTGCNFGLNTGVGVSTTVDILDLAVLTGNQFNTYVCGVCIASPYFNDLIANDNLFIVSGGVGAKIQGTGWLFNGNQGGDVTNGTLNAINILGSNATGGVAANNWFGGFFHMFVVGASVNAQARLWDNYGVGGAGAPVNYKYSIDPTSSGTLISDHQPNNFATFPPCNNAIKFAWLYVADSSVNTFLGAVAGGGNYEGFAQCDGSSWHFH